MASDSKLLLRVNAAARAGLEARGVTVALERWVQLNGLGDVECRALAKRWRAPLVEYALETVSDTVVIVARVGRRQRTLSYSAEDGRWHDQGAPMGFEDEAALRRWKKRERISPREDASQVLKSFLGATWDESSSLAREVLPHDAWDQANGEDEASPQDRLEAAARGARWTEVARILRESGRNRGVARAAAEALVHVTLQDDLRSMKRLLAAGVDVNLKADQLPLEAARSRRAVRLFLDAGAKLEAKNDHGMTPLLAQVDNLGPFTRQTVAALIDAGASLRARVGSRDVLRVLADAHARDASRGRWRIEVEPVLLDAIEERERKSKRRDRKPARR